LLILHYNLTWSTYILHMNSATSFNRGTVESFFFHLKHYASAAILKFAVLLLLFSALPAQSQTGRFINTERGLSGSVVKQIYQDSLGVIWIATNSGINLYNGYQFKTLQSNSDVPDALASNLVNCIAQDNRGRMLVGSNLALQVIDGGFHFKTVKMTSSRSNSPFNYINCVFQRKNGTILIGTAGSGLWQMTGDYEAKPISGPLGKLVTACCMLEDASGTLYVISNAEGVFSLDAHNRFRHYALPSANQYPLVACQDRLGNIFVGCLGGGLYVKNRGTDEFRLVNGTEQMHISSLCTKPSGHILIGIDGSGVRDYDVISGLITTPIYYNTEVDFSHSKVSSILYDRFGNIWLGLMQKGIYIQPTVQLGFSCMGYKLGSANVIGDHCVMALTHGRNGRLWVSTDNGGLYELDNHHKLIHKFASGGSFPSAILGMREDSKGRLWVGSYQNGCGWIDSQSGVYHRLPFSKGNNNVVFDIELDRNENLWIGTMGEGLKRYNLKNQKLTEYRATSASNSLFCNYINQLYLSPDEQRLYVCTTRGVCCLDIRRNSWTSVFHTNCLLKDVDIYDVAESSDKRLWVATPDKLYCYDLRSRKLRSYGTEQGLSSNIVMAVRLDHRQLVWVSTNNGLCCLNPRTNKVSSFYEGDGLQGNEFSDGVSSIDPHTGELCFGGMKGITWFNPERIAQVHSKLPIYLTGFSIGELEVVPGIKSGVYTITDRPVYFSDEFELNHRDNTFTIEVSSLSFDNPERVTYLYSVNGDNWTEMERGKNSVTFAHLSPGTYHIRIKAQNNVSESDIKEFAVTVHPAWYFSIWAKIVYLLIAVYLVYLYMQSLKRKQQDQLRLQEHIHAEQMSEDKLRFFINLSHDIRTPMTLILTPLLSLMKEDSDPGRQNVYALMKRNAERILHLINQIMDLRKIDKGQMTMRFAKTNIVEFTQSIVDLFSIQAKSKQITLSLKKDADPIDVWIDRTNFDKVLMNLLSNAFKFTHTGGNIVITLGHDQHNLYITIADDGDPVPEGKLERIFERFYQGSVSIQGRQTGTGVGLDLCRSIIDMHHGTIKARNLTPQGSEEKNSLYPNDFDHGCAFDICLPLGNSHLNPEDCLTKEEQKKLDRELDLSQFYDVEPQTTTVKEVKAAGTKPTVLIVEDEEDIRNYVAQQLQSSYRILLAPNGKEGLTIALKELPDLVVSDVMMPEMDGYTLCARLKGNINTNHIPVVLLTAKGRDEDKVEGIELGADAYISKPFNMEVLRSTIANLLSERAMLKNKYSGKESMKEMVEDVELKSPDEKLLERVMKVINANMSNEDLNVDLLAEEVGLSRVHLYRKLKELTNQTPSEFIRNIRLKQAANLLSDPHQSISEVMYACGFSNRTSFSTMFKKLYGVSPREYMQEAQKGKEK
jgi:signal transduction histidine kinase/DNA-binding response OmpR family regulator/ligand-binding sensor domain-containing protein